MIHNLFALIYLAGADFPFVITVEGTKALGFTDSHHAIRVLETLTEGESHITGIEDDELLYTLHAVASTEQQWAHQNFVTYQTEEV